jgi:ABC-type transport system involved in multi-copper enzyme maturation permease subunit
MVAFTVFGTVSTSLGPSAAKSINLSEHFTGLISQNISLILWAIAMSLYVAGEYKNGFIKSIAGQIPKRSYLAFSKLYFAFIYTITMFVVTFLCTFIAGLVVFRGQVEFGFSIGMIAIWCTQILLYVAFSMVMILFTQLTRSASLGIGLGIFIGSGLLSAIFTGISIGITKFTPLKSFNLSNYILETNIQYLKPGIPNDFIVRGVIVALAFAVVMIVLNRLILEKRDI